VKVLYTFDAEGKQACLARWHQFVYTPVYHVNPETPIGVVDLKTCVNSIASSSPELVALLDKDYSVYSYDYSEEGTPLQGLGLLSWIMGSGATISNGGASQQGSSRLITGRVVSAQMGLFQNEKETLEVKMKLVPVSSIKQSDYINSMNVYNTLSQIIPGNFDASSWSAYYQANQAAAQPLAPLQTVPQQTVAPSPVNQPVATHTAVEENEVPRKKPRKRNPRPPVANNNGGRKKPAVPAPSIPSAASTPTASQSDAYVPASQAPSESTFASPDLPRAVPVRQSFAHSPLADIPSVEAFVNTPQMEVPGSSPPTDDLQHVGESPRQDYSPAPTSPILPGQNDSQQEIADRLDLNKEGDILFRAQQQQEQKAQAETLSAGQTPAENTEQTMGPYPAVTLQFAPAADDSFVTAAPSPLSELQLPTNTLVQDKPARKKRKYVRKKGFMLDIVGPSETGDEENEAEKQIRSQGPTSAKERIEAQLREALKEGKMPNYCGNCGAIETPTWRRVSLKDESGDPEKDQNILLCNPCGLWHATKKSMRPPGLWDSKKDDGPPKRPRNNRKRKATGAPQTNIPQDPEYHAQLPQQMAPMSEPIVIEDGDDVPMIQARRAKTPGAGHSVTIEGWAEMVRNSQRRIQSSPVKRDGTMNSPIELD
ncbi:hypothetical protein EV426DRAFT_518176, partial [Tirmania nivea]